MDADRTTSVILIGGPPKSGKTHVARRLAAHFGYVCISTDDLHEAARAVTNEHSFPDLHPMAGFDYREYFVLHSVEQLVSHYEREHEACWPAVASVIWRHGTWGHPAVIDGWDITPERATALRLPNVTAIWLLPTDDVLERNTRARPSFYAGASDAELMLKHYLARSQHHAAQLKASVQRFSMLFVDVVPDSSTDDLVDACLRLVSRSEHSNPDGKGGICYANRNKME